MLTLPSEQTLGHLVVLTLSILPCLKVSLLTPSHVPICGGNGGIMPKDRINMSLSILGQHGGGLGGQHPRFHPKKPQLSPHFLSQL